MIIVNTDIPPNMSAGLEMAYVVNEERELDHKSAQLVLTAFVSLNTSVGHIR